MYIYPKPVFKTIILNRAAADCPSDYTSCTADIGPGPALVPLTNDDAGPATAPADPSATTGTLAPTPSSALATDIQHFGKRNFVGLLVLGLFALVGLVLWLTFGAWPRRMVRRLRARFGAGRSGEGGDASAAGNSGKRDLGAQGGQKQACQDQNLDAVHKSLHEPGEEDKVETAMDADAPCSSRSNEVEVEGFRHYVIMD